jgi:hypothetical protein
VAGRRFGAVREGALGGAQQQLDAGETLGQGVVDLAGKPFPFGGHAGGMLGDREVGAGLAEFLDQPAPLLALGVEGLVAEHGCHGDRRAERGPDDHADRETVLVPGEPGDRGHGGDRDDRQSPPGGEQVQLQEEQRKRQPHPVRGQPQQHQPHRAE